VFKTWSLITAVQKHEKHENRLQKFWDLSTWTKNTKNVNWNCETQLQLCSSRSLSSYDTYISWHHFYFLSSHGYRAAYSSVQSPWIRRSCPNPTQTRIRKFWTKYIFKWKF
jgi:hypothetical protein